MNRKAIAALAGLGVAALMAAPALAAAPTSNPGAQRSSILPQTTSDMGQCQSSAGGHSTAPNGFVILNSPGQPGSPIKTIGEVSLKNAIPGTYTIWLADNSNNCRMTDGVVTVGDNGNGNGHFDDIVPGQTGLSYVVLRQGMNEVYASGPVTLN